MSKGLLVAAFDFSKLKKDEFHDWYDLEHIPERQSVAGFEICERWLSETNNSVSVATYDLTNIEVMRSFEYQAIAYSNSSVWTKRITTMCMRLLRFDGSQITPGDVSSREGAGALLVNAMNISPEVEREFNAWYDQEHLPALNNVPGNLSGRRFKTRADDPDRTHDYVAIYHLESANITRSEAWISAVNTPWSAKIKPHFRDHIRILARKYDRNIDRFGG